SASRRPRDRVRREGPPAARTPGSGTAGGSLSSRPAAPRPGCPTRMGSPWSPRIDRASVCAQGPPAVIARLRAGWIEQGAVVQPAELIDRDGAGVVHPLADEKERGELARRHTAERAGRPDDRAHAVAIEHARRRFVRARIAQALPLDLVDV